MSERTLVIIELLLVCFLASMRLLSHLPSLTLFIILSLLVLWKLRRNYSVIALILVLVLSDWLRGFYDWKISFSLYWSLMLVGFLSRLEMRPESMRAVSKAFITAPLIFFGITSFSPSLIDQELQFGQVIIDTFYITLIVVSFEAIIVLKRWRILHAKTA